MPFENWELSPGTSQSLLLTNQDEASDYELSKQVQQEVTAHFLISHSAKALAGHSLVVI
jgi:hypothetical protein